MGESDLFVPTKVEIELEADRVGLCNAILKDENDALTLRREGMLTSEGDLSVAGSTQSSMQDSKALEGSRKARPAKVKPAKRPARVVSEYCIDFGHVVKGTQRVKRPLTTVPSAEPRLEPHNGERGEGGPAPGDSRGARLGPAPSWAA